VAGPSGISSAGAGTPAAALTKLGGGDKPGQGGGSTSSPSGAAAEGVEALSTKLPTAASPTLSSSDGDTPHPVNPHPDKKQLSSSGDGVGGSGGQDVDHDGDVDVPGNAFSATGSGSGLGQDIDHDGDVDVPGNALSAFGADSTEPDDDKLRPKGSGNAPGIGDGDGEGDDKFRPKGQGNAIGPNDSPADDDKFRPKGGGSGEDPDGDPEPGGPNPLNVFTNFGSVVSALNAVRHGGDLGEFLEKLEEWALRPKGSGDLVDPDDPSGGQAFSHGPATTSLGQIIKGIHSGVDLTELIEQIKEWAYRPKGSGDYVDPDHESGLASSQQPSAFQSPMLAWWENDIKIGPGYLSTIGGEEVGDDRDRPKGGGDAPNP
jgi:hypothetical protein